MQLDASIAAIVTGGASGLGAATAQRLAGHGVKVALFDLNAELGQQIAGEIGGVFCRVDVTSEAEVDAGFVRSRALIGQERILVNCAGTGNAYKTAGRDRESGEIRHFPLDAFERIIQINLIKTSIRGRRPTWPRSRACGHCRRAASPPPGTPPASMMARWR